MKRINEEQFEEVIETSKKGYNLCYRSLPDCRCAELENMMRGNCEYCGAEGSDNTKFAKGKCVGCNGQNWELKKLEYDLSSKESVTTVASKSLGNPVKVLLQK